MVVEVGEPFGHDLDRRADGRGAIQIAPYVVRFDFVHTPVGALDMLHDEKFWDRVTALGTAGAALAAAAAAAASFLQFRATREQAELGRQQTELALRQNTIAADQAVLAKRQTEISLDTERRQLRSYLDVSPDTERKIGSDIIFYGLVKNVGLTPAYRIRMDYHVSKAAPPGDGTDDRFKEVAINAYLSQGASYPFSFRSGLGEPAEQTIASEGGHIFLFGHVQYTDIFGSKHNLKYCFDETLTGDEHDRAEVNVAPCNSPVFALDAD